MQRRGAEQSQSLQKDAFIASLKKELFELSENEQRFLALNEEITRADSRLINLEDRRQRILRQGQSKGEQTRKNVAQLRMEVDALKIQIHKGGVLIEDILRTRSTLQRSCDHKDSQTASLLASAQELEASTDQLTQGNRALVAQIKALKEERNRTDIEIQRLARSSQDFMAALKALEKEARTLQSSNSKLQSILHQAEQDQAELINEADSQQQKVALIKTRTQQLTREIEDVRAQNNRFQLQCDKSKGQLKSTIEQLNAAVERSRSIAKELKGLQMSLRGGQNELDKALVEKDELEQLNLELSNQHGSLNGQVDRVLVQVIQYERINAQLQSEIQNYIQSDEAARAMLDRKDAMRSLLTSVTAKLNKTKEPIAHLR